MNKASAQINSSTAGSLCDRLDFLDEIDQGLRQSFVEGAMLIELKNRSVLFDQGELAEAFFIVLSGMVKLVRRNKSENTLIDLVSPMQAMAGLLLHEESILTFPVTAVSIGESEVLRISREVFLKTWQKSERASHFIQSQNLKCMTIATGDE